MIACLLLHMFRHLGDLLTIKMLKGRIKNLYCQNRDILGFCEHYLKLLRALYNCASNISAAASLMVWEPNVVLRYFMSSGKQPFHQLGLDPEKILQEYLKGNEPRCCKECSKVCNAMGLVYGTTVRLCMLQCIEWYMSIHVHHFVMFL